MTDWATISSIATAGGTLVLAIATFSSVRAASASTRLSERALLAAQRPVLIPSREDDAPEQVRFVDEVLLRLPGHSGVAKLKEDNVYLAMALRNGGAGLAVILRLAHRDGHRQPHPAADRRRRLPPPDA